MVFFDENQAASEAASAFEASLRLWGTLSPCRTAERHGVLLLSTGTAIPDQNYALKTGEGPIPLMAGEALTFFASENMPFTWWVPPERGRSPKAGSWPGLGFLFSVRPLP